MSTATATETRQKIRLPSQWKVVVKNDDVTPDEYVLRILQDVFEKDEDEAIQLIRIINAQDRAVVFTHTLEVVRQKVDEVNKLNVAFGMTLKVIKEEA